MLSCAGADRLQTGMRGAFGKPLGTVARVNIGQPIMSVRAKDTHKAHCIEAFRRAKFKFPGRQKVNKISNLIQLFAFSRLLRNFLVSDLCVQKFWIHQISA